MSQDLLYSVLARPTLKPSDLVYRRRVNASNGKDDTKSTGSKEHKYESQNDVGNNFETVLETEKESRRIDDIV